MEKNKELIKNTIIILLGKFCTQFLSFFLLPLYTSILSANEYGIYDLIVTYVALFVPVISLQMEMAIFRELIDVRGNYKKTSEIISSGIFSVILQFIICFICYYLISVFINIPYKNYIIINILAVMVSSIFMQIARGLGQNVQYSISSVIAGVSTILLNILFLVILKFNVEGMIISAILSNIFAAIYIFISCKLYGKIKYSSVSKQIIHKLLKYSLPLVPNGLIWWIINVSDRTIISIFLGTGANGIYAVSNKFSSIIMQIFNIFNLSWTESASLHINDEDKNKFFSSVFNKTLKYSLVVCLLIIAALPFLFNILISQSYSEAYVYIPILLIGMIFNIIVSFLGSIYVSKKLTKEVAKTSFCAGVLNILINVFLVKCIGIFAAAISTVLAFLIMSIFRIVDVQKYVKLKINFKEINMALLLFLISLLLYYFNNKFISAIYLVFIIAYIFIDNKNYINLILKKIKNQAEKNRLFVK